MISRHHPLFLTVSAFFITLACLSLINVVWAHRRTHDNGDTPGQFAYYLLALSWSPTFCLSSPDAAECQGLRRYGFIVHGLWPQNEHGWPEYCGINSPVPDKVVRDIADLMPARNLVYHEWAAHGTCSGLEPMEFFALLRRGYLSIVIPRQFLSIAQTIEQSPAWIANQFILANPGLSKQSIVVTCIQQGMPRLREVRFCLDRDLRPRACTADALREACTAPQLLIPPLR